MLIYISIFYLSFIINIHTSINEIIIILLFYLRILYKFYIIIYNYIMLIKK